MFCPRIKHFVRLNYDGTIGKCGHMMGKQHFNSFQEMENSEWLQNIKTKMSNDEWPEECVRCEQTENINGSSIRTKSFFCSKLLCYILVCIRLNLMYYKSFFAIRC